MSHHDELLRAARQQLGRRAGPPGRLTTAGIRRSISTSYYALFHFLTEQCGIRLIGAGDGLSARRRLLARTITHTALRLTLKKVSGSAVADDVREFLRGEEKPGKPVLVPIFLTRLAKTFLDAQELRFQADYDLSARFAALDAERIIDAVDEAISAWNLATRAEERRLKKAICLLIILRGRLRSDDA